MIFLLHQTQPIKALFRGVRMIRYSCLDAYKRLAKLEKKYAVVLYPLVDDNAHPLVISILQNAKGRVSSEDLLAGGLFMFDDLSSAEHFFSLFRGVGAEHFYAQKLVGGEVSECSTDSLFQGA
jgi:hypothetical protein